MMRRMGLLVLAVLLPMALAGLGIHALGLRDAMANQVEARNDDAASAVALALAQRGNNIEAVQDLAASLFKLGKYHRLELLDGQERAIVSHTSSNGQALAPSWFVRLLPLEAAPGQAMLEHERRAWGHVRVETRTAWAHDALWTALSRASALLALVASVALLIVVWVLRGWQRPLDAAVAQAKAMQQGRFVIADEPRLPELRELALSMNAMVLRLRESFDVQAEQVAELQRQAQFDALTQLPGRHLFLNRLQGLLAESDAPGGALLLVRVMRLDVLNQRLGHESTNRLLGSLADVLQSYVDRVPAAFAGRLNGSDFALGLPVSGVAQETADSLLTALLASPVARMGGAEFALGGVDGLRGVASGAALAAADAALARSEAEGGRVVESLDAQAHAVMGERAWRDQIALALDEGRVMLVEYPVLDAKGELIHLECPLRVQMGVGGPFQTAQRWLALAQRSRLMPRVDLRALDLALAATARDGRPRCVHVAQASLAEPGFAGEMLQRLAAAPGAAKRLYIECVESARPASEEGFKDAAAAWRHLGARVGVEHAGSSPQTLARWHAAGIDYVKIDARHLRGLAKDAAAHAYAGGLVALIHSLGLSALAEGVDDSGDLAAVWALGFDGATGPALNPSV